MLASLPPVPGRDRLQHLALGPLSASFLNFLTPLFRYLENPGVCFCIMAPQWLPLGPKKRLQTLGRGCQWCWGVSQKFPANSGSTHCGELYSPVSPLTHSCGFLTGQIGLLTAGTPGVLGPRLGDLVRF